MKIAIVRKDFVFGGGAERYAIQLAGALIAQGHDVHVFAHRHEAMDGITFHTVPTTSRISILKNWTFALNARRALKDDSFDIVYALSPLYPVDIYRMGDGIHRHWLTIRKDGFLTRAWNLISPRHRLLLQLEKKIFSPRNFWKVIANSNLCKRHAMQYYSVPEHRIEVIYNGIDFDRFNPSVHETGKALRRSLEIPDDDLVILFAGMNFSRKGLKPLLEAMGQAKEKHRSRLLVVGKGNIKPYAHLAEDLCLSRSVTFCGFQKDLEPYYGCADIFVLPTQYDPCANVCLEAMACGLPVITTRENGASELILQEKSGFIMEQPDDIRALSEWIEILRNREVRNSMGRLAQEQVSSLSLHENALRTIHVCEKVLREKRLGGLRS